MARTADVKANGRAAARTSRAAPAPRPPRPFAVFDRIGRYVQDVRAELLKVHWPSRQELIASTSVVLVVLILASLYLGAWDAIFTWLVQTLLRR